MPNRLLSILLAVLLLCTPAFVPAHADPVRQTKPAQVNRQEETVFFNVRSRKFHKHSCVWAAKCTRNCITIPKPEAIIRGGVPCKVCGG